MKNKKLLKVQLNLDIVGVFIERSYDRSHLGIGQTTPYNHYELLLPHIVLFFYKKCIIGRLLCQYGMVSYHTA